MLILSRKCGERVVIGPNIELTVMKLSKSSVRLAIDAPQEIVIHRQEIHRRIQDDGAEVLANVPAGGHPGIGTSLPLQTGTRLRQS